MRYALVMLLLLVGLSCGGPKEDTLVGKWADVNGKDRIEFTADGKFRGIMAYGTGAGLTPIEGTYVITGGDMVAVNLSNGISMVWKVKDVSHATVEFIYRQGGSLKIDGSIAKFERAK